MLPVLQLGWADGREVALKVAWQHTEALHEAEGLAALSGHGAVEVYAFAHLDSTRPRDGPGGDTDTTAMLLERCRLLIDPKPYVGDSHYDVLQHLLNCNEPLQADPIRLLTEVADLTGLDTERVRRWLFARCVQEILGDGPSWPGLDVLLSGVGAL